MSAVPVRSWPNTHCTTSTAFKWLLAIAMSANKVWLSELEHQRVGWIWQQHTACRSQWAGGQLNLSRSCNQHQSCAPAGQIGEPVVCNTLFALILLIWNQEKLQGILVWILLRNLLQAKVSVASSTSLIFRQPGLESLWNEDVTFQITPLAASERLETEVCQFPNGHVTFFDPKQLYQVAFLLV